MSLIVMLKERIDQLLSVRRNQLILVSVVILLLLGGLKLLSTSNKPSTYICDSNSCSGGCCVKNKCLPKSIAIADYTCLGEGKWRAADGKVSSAVPEAVVREVEDVDRTITTGGNKMPEGKEEIKISTQEAHQIAAKIIDWLDTMKNDKGQYYTGDTCQPDGSCKRSEAVDKQWGILVLWGRYRNYINNSDKEEMKKIDEDLLALTTKDIGYPAQNDNYNCLLMFELYQSDVFNQNQKENIEKICHGSIYYGEETQELLGLLQKGKDIEEPPIEKVINGQSLSLWPIVDKNNYKKYAVYSADLIPLYKWFNDPEDLKGSKYFFNLALQIYSQSDPDLIDAPIGLAAVKLNQATGEKKYLDFADYFLRKKITKGCIATDDCIYYLLFLDELLKRENDLNITNEINRTRNYLIDNGYNDEKGAVRTLSRGIYSFDTINNALFAGYLAGVE